MKATSILLMALCSIMAAAGLVHGAPADESLIAFAQQRTNAVRITKKPVRMFDVVARLCATQPPAVQRILTNAAADPHSLKYAHVFVSPQAAPAMLTKSAVFPVGAIILKEKFGDENGKTTELFTGMLKRESGYNQECGDWEFFTLSADANKVTSRGKLQNCMACHVDYKNSDFVTKSYARISN